MPSLSRSVFEDGMRDALMDSYSPVAGSWDRWKMRLPPEYRAGYQTGTMIEFTAQMPPRAAGWEERNREAYLIARNAMKCSHCLDRIVDWRDRVMLDDWKSLHEDCRDAILAEREQESADYQRELLEDCRQELREEDARRNNKGVSK